LQRLQPTVNVSRVILPHLGRDAKISAQECGTEFSDQFFQRVTFVTPALADEVTVQTRARFTSVGLMPISA
jgi:hypothetical protein